VRSRFLTEGALPASTLVGVERLVDPDLLLEVEVIAALGAAKRSSPKKKKKKKR
jgi:enamine deaminase RidA (YjgF/YER057c/UK114 family)